MKKKILVLVALMVFFSAWLPNVSEAAVATKVISQAAKKTAKEATKEIAIDMSFNMVMNYKYIPKDQRKPKEGFEMVCLPKDKKPDGDCSAPIQVKKKVTRSEIGPVIEQQLEKKIAGGVTATKWGKFLDWFVPVFATGLGVAIIDYAINGDVMDLFDEIAYDSLVEMGYIDTLSGEPGTGNGKGFVRPIVNLPELPLVADGWLATNLRNVDKIDSMFDCVGVSDCIKFEVVHTDFALVLRVLPKGDGNLRVNFNGVDFLSKDFGFTPDYNILILKQYATTKQGLDKNTLESYRVDPALAMDESSYVRAHDALPGPGGNATLKNPEVALQGMLNLARFASEPIEVFGKKKPPLLFTYVPGSGGGEVDPIPPETTIPKFDEAQLQPTRKPGTNMPVVAPGAYPMIETGTGTKVYPYRDADGNIIYKTEDGRVVQDESITVQNPTITENPDGGITVEKAPTPEDTNPPPGEIPGNPEFPEGETCSASLKKPNFEPLSTAFTTSFPFSIPWDLKRMFEAVFSEIGSSKPEFKYSFDFNGKQHSWNITVPEYFDKWVVFSNSLLLIIFDVGLIYMIYRFTRGGD